MSSNLVTGIAAMKRLQKQREEALEAASLPRANWFKFDSGVNEYEVQFLQELDEDSPGYDPKHGKALVAIERISPTDFRKRALDTMESEGRCWPEEWHKKARNDPDYKGGWKPRTNFYITVLTERIVDGEKVKRPEILSRNFNSSFVEDLIDYAVDEETITNKKFIIKKSGAGTQTRWSLKPVKNSVAEPFNGVAYDLKNVAVRTVPYDEQPTFFGVTEKTTTTQEKQESDEIVW